MSVREGKIYRLCVNGFSVEARFSPEEIETVLDKVLMKIRSAHEENRNHNAVRTVIYLSGPPGAGKSTLALSLVERSKEISFPYRMQCLGLDGFHKRSSVLKSTYILLNGKSVLMNNIKGAPETFDQGEFLKRLEECVFNKKASWPVYDRTIHDVSDKEEEIEGEILMVEGNWLMLPGMWAKAKENASYTISLSASFETLKRRLIERKIRGGKTADEAEKWFELVDGPNVRRYQNESSKSDLYIEDGDGGMRIKRS